MPSSLAAGIRTKTSSTRYSKYYGTAGKADGVKNANGRCNEALTPNSRVVVVH
jgi:hypothetical protein